MKVGFAEKDITTDLPRDRPHRTGADNCNAVADPLKARAAVFDDGQTRIALVGCDTESMPRGVAQKARQRIEEACGIPAGNVLISASHAHSAPFKTIVEPGLFDDAPEDIQHLAYHEYSCPSPDYVDFAVRQIAAAVNAADRDRADALCAVGSGREDSVTFNRRFRMKNGQTWTHPGKNHPDILEPAGGIDPEVGVIGAWDAGETFRGCVVNFGCHGTTGRGEGKLSADWVYYLEQTIRGAMGQDTVVVFLNGTCGDVTQINNQTDERLEKGDWAARRVGQCVGAEALKVLAKAARGDLAPLSACSEVLHIPRLHPNPERVRRALELVRRPPADAAEHDVYHAKKVVLLDALVKLQPEAEVEVQALQVGPAVFVANPTEFFVKSGQAVKAASAFPFTYVVELANGCVGYTPPKEEFLPSGGGMETWLLDYRNLVPEAEEQIVRSSQKLAGRLTPGRIPEHPKQVEPFPPFATNPPELE